MNSRDHLPNLNPSKHAFRISALYFLISTLWIIVSDLINAANHNNALNELLVDISKGLIFIIITSVLLYFLLLKYFTALHEKHSELYSNEEKYRTLAENLEFCVMRHDMDCRYIYVNKAAWEMLKVLLRVKSIEEIIGLTPEEIYIDPLVAKTVRDGNNLVISSGKTLSEKLHYGEKYISYSKIPELNERGEIISVMTLIADETEIMKNLIRLEESERFNSHLVNSSHVVVYVYDLKNRNQVFANKALERILGYDLEEIRDPKINILRDLMHPDDAKEMVKYVQTEVMRLKDGEVAEFEYRMKHKEGHYCWFKSHDCVFKRDENGFPLEILGSAIDITDLKHTQHEVKKKSEYLKAVIEASPMSIFDVTPEGRILSIWNKACEEMFGWKADEVMGKTLPIVPEERMNELEDNLRMIIEHKFINGKEIIRRKKDGSSITLKLYSCPVTEIDGRIDSIIAFTEDITIEKKYEKANLENANYLKLLYETGLMASNVNDIRDLFKKSYEALSEITEVDGLVLSSITPDRKFFKCDAITIRGIIIDPSKLPLLKLDPEGSGPQSIAVRTGSSFIIENEEYRKRDKVRSIFVDMEGNIINKDEEEDQAPKSSIIIPLKHNEVVIGVLQVQSYKSGFYTKEDLMRLEPFAFILASAINRIKLHGKLQNELAEKAAAFEQIRKFTKGIENSPNGIIITNAKYEIEYVNPCFTEMTGYEPDEIRGKNPSILQSGKTAIEVYQNLWSTLDKGEVWHGEFLNMKKNGELYWESASIGPITDENGTVTHFIAIKQDITDKKKKDKELKDSLEEKEVMLKEIHHRVKNNLQVISSLLNMQVEQYKHPEAIDAINSSRNRVKAMALVHENLYQNKSIGKASLKEYMIKLAKNIYSSYGVRFEKVKFLCETNGIEFGLDTIIPLGLILNESISNSLKHAFPGDASGEISVLLENTKEAGINVSRDQLRSNSYRLKIKDNGKGLPADFDPAKTNSLGMTLLTSLAAQLDGEAVINNKAGTEIIINFRELRYKSRV